jgi:hypothetical protein
MLSVNHRCAARKPDDRRLILIARLLSKAFQLSLRESSISDNTFTIIPFAGFRAGRPKTERADRGPFRRSNQQESESRWEDRPRLTLLECDQERGENYGSQNSRRKPNGIAIEFSECVPCHLTPFAIFKSRSSQMDPEVAMHLNVLRDMSKKAIPKPTHQQYSCLFRVTR